MSEIFLCGLVCFFFCWVDTWLLGDQLPYIKTLSQSLLFSSIFSSFVFDASSLETLQHLMAGTLSPFSIFRFPCLVSLIVTLPSAFQLLQGYGRDSLFPYPVTSFFLCHCGFVLFKSSITILMEPLEEEKVNVCVSVFQILLLTDAAACESLQLLV